MSTKALVKTADPAPNPASDEQAQMREAIFEIIRQEYCGDLRSELWLRPAKAATARIMRAIYSER
jgi:hypothetical protein